MPTLGELCTAIGGRLLPVGEARRALAKSRWGRSPATAAAIEPGEVFWALRGRNHDGEDFVADAFRRGAAGAVVAKDVAPPPNRWVVRVDDTHRALDDGRAGDADNAPAR